MSRERTPLGRACVSATRTSVNRLSTLSHTHNTHARTRLVKSHTLVGCRPPLLGRCRILIVTSSWALVGLLGAAAGRTRGTCTKHARMGCWLHRDHHEWLPSAVQTIPYGQRCTRLTRRRAAAGITRGPPLTSSRTSEASSEAAPYRRSDHEFG